METAPHKPKITPLLAATYLAVIKNSIGSTTFRNLYADIDGIKKDITENGNLSCAFFVSSLLKMFDLIKSQHATVVGTVRDLKDSGWQEIATPEAGCVLVWDKVDFGDGRLHQHIGFYVGGERAVSNDSKTGTIYEHDYLFNGERPLEIILKNPNLNLTQN